MKGGKFGPKCVCKEKRPCEDTERRLPYGSKEEASDPARPSRICILDCIPLAYVTVGKHSVG